MVKTKTKTYKKTKTHPWTDVKIDLRLNDFAILDGFAKMGPKPKAHQYWWLFVKIVSKRGPRERIFIKMSEFIHLFAKQRPAERVRL